MGEKEEVLGLALAKACRLPGRRNEPVGGSLRCADPAGARGSCWLQLCVKGLQPGARPSPRGPTLGRHLEWCGVEGRSRITRFSAKSQSCREVLAEGFDDTSQASETGDTQASGSALGFSGHGFPHTALQTGAAEASLL